MGLTKHQIKILEAIGKTGVNRKIASTKLGITQANVDNTLSHIFMDFKEIITTIDEYYPVFERRLVNEDKVDVYQILRRIARQMRQG